MKKIFLIGVLALYATTSAQTNYGLKAGYALSKINSKELENSLQSDTGISISNDAKSGFYVGAFVEHKLNDKFALQGELQYANLGGMLSAKVDQSGINFTLQGRLNFNQILLPISAKYYATPKLALYAGPSVAFNAGYKTEMKLKDSNIPASLMGDVQDEFNTYEEQQDNALKENLKSTAFNVFLGGEYTFYKQAFLEARYTLGLTNYEKNPVNGSTTKMNYFQVGLGYKF